MLSVHVNFGPEGADSTVDFEVIYLVLCFFATREAYVAITCVQSPYAFQIEEINYFKLTGRDLCSGSELYEMGRLHGAKKNDSGSPTQKSVRIIHYVNLDLSLEINYRF